jgi:6-phosphofructokinase
MADKKTIMIIAGGQLKGLGASLKALDPDTKGTDDLVGNILNSGGTILISAAVNDIKSQRTAVTLIRDAAQEWLDTSQ